MVTLTAERVIGGRLCHTTITREGGRQAGSTNRGSVYTLSQRGGNINHGGSHQVD